MCADAGIPFTGGWNCNLSCLTVLARREMSRDAELLVLRHENAVLRRQIIRVRYRPADRLWLAVRSKLIHRRRWGEVFAVSPATVSFARSFLAAPRRAAPVRA
jgi:hypothetical protein